MFLMKRESVNQEVHINKNMLLQACNPFLFSENITDPR